MLIDGYEQMPNTPAEAMGEKYQEPRQALKVILASYDSLVTPMSMVEVRQAGHQMCHSVTLVVEIYNGSFH